MIIAKLYLCIPGLGTSNLSIFFSHLKCTVFHKVGATIVPFYQGGNWSIERLTNLLNLTQLENGGARICSRLMDSESFCIYYAIAITQYWTVCIMAENWAAEEETCQLPYSLSYFNSCITLRGVVSAEKI